jgi:hypothetical protein
MRTFKICVCVCSNAPTGPLFRYWLHILELVTWYAEVVSRLEGSGAPGAGGDSSATAGAGAVFSKARAYLLLTHLQEAADCYGSAFLLQQVAHGSAAGAADFDGGSSDGDSAESSLRALRLSLLGLLSSAVVAENARRSGEHRGAGGGVSAFQETRTMPGMAPLMASGARSSAMGRRTQFPGGGSEALTQFGSAAGSRERRKLDAAGKGRSLQEQEAYEMLSGASLAFM